MSERHSKKSNKTLQWMCGVRLFAKGSGRFIVFAFSIVFLSPHTTELCVMPLIKEDDR